MAKIRLSEELKKQKISKRQFTIMMKSDTGTMGRYYRGDGNPTLATLDKWAKALGVKIKDLVKD
jgi:transcriptional regulator with XRE-family HTH domain